MNWSQSVDSLLDKIRLNAVYLTNRHINNHLYYKNCSKYFEIPTIVLSVFSGSFSVGSDGFLNQELILLLSAPECTMRASSEVRSDNPHGAAGKAA